jgi:hypothetical protein
VHPEPQLVEQAVLQHQTRDGPEAVLDDVLVGRLREPGDLAVRAPVWPTRSGDPASDQFNSMRKYVVSTTLKDPEWNNAHVIDGGVAGDGRPGLIFGYATLDECVLAEGIEILAEALRTDIARTVA